MPDSARFHPIPYRADSSTLFAALRHLPYAIWLDSGKPGSRYGRYDIFSADPERLLTTRGELTRLQSRDGSLSESRDNPFRLLAQHLPSAASPVPGLPFCGGALGYFGYDLGRRLEQLPNLAVQDIDQPDMCVGIYPWAVVQDHQEQLAWVVALPGTDAAEIARKHRFHDLTNHLNNTNFPFKISKFKANINADKYAKDLASIQAYIHAGDCYQVNYAQRFEAEFEGEPYAAYLALRSALPSPFSGFMQLDEGAILSLSPERFIRVCDQTAETQPIKGTIKRGATPGEDQRNAEQLQASPKDRAENLMIVDLLRNDLSKTCNQVRTPALFELQSFANVHHLVSTITGQLKPGTTPVEVLEGCFPGGSITGAPKIRAMEIIEELEPTRRSVYCGSLGYLSADGNMDTSIAIRTLVCDRERIYCWGGGGIVADSETEQEYQESIAKVKVLMETLEREFL